MLRAMQSDVVPRHHGGASDETVRVPAPLLAAKERDTLEMAIRRVEKSHSAAFLVVLSLHS